uniref:Uncharacterized protein n=1 Tax=Rhizophora mucronata TaxID=61149 RepID=A0A2P2JHK2_RHIMU
MIINKYPISFSFSLSPRFHFLPSFAE